MGKFEIKVNDGYGNWQHLPGTDGSESDYFETYQSALDYINNVISTWILPGQEFNPDDYEIFEVE